MTMGPTEGPVSARLKEQQGLEERKENIRTGEPTKLTPWAVGHEREQSRGKGEGQAKGTLKKIEGKMREW